MNCFIRKNLLIKIINKEGFLPRMMKQFLNARQDIKIILKQETDTDTKIELNSKSWCYKVLANATGFGVNGSGFFKYSNVFVAMTITAIGRFLINHVNSKLNEKHIEIDTDGIYAEGFIDAEKLSFDLNNFIYEQLGITTTFKLERDEYTAGYFLKMKNYILLDKKGNLIKHGVSLKASSKNKIFDYTLNKIARAILEAPEQLSEIAVECYNKINTAEIPQFIQQTKINRPIKEYSQQPSIGKKGCLQVQVGNQSQKFHDTEIVTGDSIAYVKSHSGYTIRENIKSMNIIDKSYYRKQVISVLKKFDLDKIIWKVKHQGQQTLNDNIFSVSS